MSKTAEALVWHAELYRLGFRWNYGTLLMYVRAMFDGKAV